jgi:hypothetical protein
MPDHDTVRQSKRPRTQAVHVVPTGGLRDSRTTKFDSHFKDVDPQPPPQAEREKQAGPPPSDHASTESGIRGANGTGAHATAAPLTQAPAARGTLGTSVSTNKGSAHTSLSLAGWLGVTAPALAKMFVEAVPEGPKRPAPEANCKVGVLGVIKKNTLLMRFKWLWHQPNKRAPPGLEGARAYKFAPAEKVTVHPCFGVAAGPTQSPNLVMGKGVRYQGGHCWIVPDMHDEIQQDRVDLSP